ncbi:hypothetical protein HanRHA438_Chr12g0576481 [Helianthus annuus]|uniref:Uncharacterized protein n=1 Tax=Helianthus annuus TaxID=4232 RepID=A0A9K3HKC0_HELAN|nr:hypothetical protein HanXRQr2_Chr12g0565101 [Helianthus annuus]KAJ0491158.1 hypothetical protein HanHA300_Chr12g0463711 [Helianthus annuus]KAJ0495579.1 hypothetical protein HanIR_Chr12g0610361 [Helianthus annuus]KAJ0507080.1 hypothetical protein HanHA89_Chr12g0489211 [Helianthus annuus]KAJ0676709.1 hypothetical protein HanLR1_Chr12g0465781 [Helianthus annuus]
MNFMSSRMALIRGVQLTYLLEKLMIPTTFYPQRSSLSKGFTTSFPVYEICVIVMFWCTMSLFLPLGNKGECISQLLLVLSKMNLVFSYVPEFYLETLVDCFHVLRKSDPPFVYKTRTWFICYFCGYPFQRPENIKHRTKRSTSAINFCISSVQRVFGCF